MGFIVVLSAYSISTINITVKQTIRAWWWSDVIGAEASRGTELCNSGTVAVKNICHTINTHFRQEWTAGQMQGTAALTEGNYIINR